jgi:arsenate reductase
MAEGLARRTLPGEIAVFSAGSRPTRVNPRAIEALSEVGIDSRHQRSKSLDEIPTDQVDCVITLCNEGEEDCPVFLGDVLRLYWPMPDPGAVEGGPDEIMAAFRAVRDQLAERIQALAAQGEGG